MYSINTVAYSFLSAWFKKVKSCHLMPFAQPINFNIPLYKPALTASINLSISFDKFA
jgi:hypothetical protein